jgi:hypothetical protein
MVGVSSGTASGVLEFTGWIQGWRGTDERHTLAYLLRTLRVRESKVPQERSKGCSSVLANAQVLKSLVPSAKSARWNRPKPKWRKAFALRHVLN